MRGIKIAGFLGAALLVASAGSAALKAPLPPANAASSNSSAPLVIGPDQVRSLQSNSGPFSLTYTVGQPPIPAACPASLAGSRFDLVSEIIADYTPANGGGNTNTAGEGILGYFDFGPIVGTLNCDNNLPPTTALTDTNTPLLDGIAVIRYSLAGVDVSTVTAAAIDINPAPKRCAFWTTYAVSGCAVDAGIWTLNPALDQEPAVANDCIYDERDYVGFISFIQAHDVLMNESLDNPADGNQYGGESHISFFNNNFNIPAQGVTRNVTIPLNENALKVIRGGGNPAGYFEVVVRMADPRGSRSEGPGGTCLIGGLAGHFQNVQVIEDQDGIWFQDKGLAAKTNLILSQ